MGLSRVTYQSISQNSLFGLQSALSRTQDLQNQLSTGRRVSKPSDDPAAAGSSMALRSQRSADEQYIRNSDAATGRLNVTDNTLQTVTDRLQRVRDLVITGRDGAIGSDSQAALATEVSSIRDDMISIYNTRYQDRPIFGGTVPGTDAVDPAGTYIGDDQPVQARISREGTVRVDVKGSDVGADTVPGLLAQISTDMTSNPTNLSADLDAIDAELKKVATAVADVGARASRVDSTKSNVDSDRLDLTSRISANEDADLPETIMNLQTQQVAYQAALWAASKVLTTSLVDFLK
jgi:flagellar hook-associated protein 3 FlgL